MADYDLRCPFCGAQTVGGRCPNCAQGPERSAPSGVNADRTSAHVEVPVNERSKRSVDRLAIYTPEGGRPGTFARVATLLAASISAGAFVVLVLLLLVGLGAALVGAVAAASPWLSVMLVILCAVILVVLAVLATGLSIIWKHRGDYSAARRAASEAANTHRD